MTEQVQPYMSWLEIWIHAITNPTAQGLGVLIRRPVASIRTALIWMIISGIVGAMCTAGLAQLLHPLEYLVTQPLPDPITITYRIGLFLRSCVISMGTGVLSLLLMTGMQHGFARMLKGFGDYRELIYVTAAYSAPITIVLSFFAALTLRLFGLFIVLVIISVLFQFGLMIATMKAVYRFSSGKAWLAGSILPSIVLAVLAFVLINIMAVTGIPDVF